MYAKVVNRPVLNRAVARLEKWGGKKNMRKVLFDMNATWNWKRTRVVRLVFVYVCGVLQCGRNVLLQAERTVTAERKKLCVLLHNNFYELIFFLDSSLFHASTHYRRSMSRKWKWTMYWMDDGLGCMWKVERMMLTTTNWVFSRACRLFFN